jgi:hypothetical protein
MCGIVGFIGKSTNPKITYSLVSSLLVKTEVRGKEATGVWAAQEGENGKVLFHKEPVPSSQFVTRDIWKHLRAFDPTVLISHCREPSAHAGPPKVNRNNHPHVNETHTLAVVHNGKVEEYHQLKFKGYQKKLRGECDSELIRELFTIGDEFGDDNELYSSRYAGLDRNLGPRLLGIDRIFAKLKGGAMAVAVGERLEQSHRALWLWRDDKRPLWLVDLRPSLGQVFFCSTAQIWREAVDAAPDVKAFLPADHELYDFPSFHSYLFEIDPDQSDTPADPQHPDFQKNGWEGGWRLRKFKVVRTTKDGEEPELKPKADAQQRPPLRVSVVTMLADNEDVLDHQVIRHPGHEPEELEPTAAADTQIEDGTGRDREERTSPELRPKFAPCYAVTVRERHALRLSFCASVPLLPCLRWLAPLGWADTRGNRGPRNRPLFQSTVQLHTVRPSNCALAQGSQGSRT